MSPTTGFRTEARPHEPAVCLGDAWRHGSHGRVLVDRHAETLGNQLREGGLVTLAMAVRTGEDFDGADRVDADFR